MTYSELWRPLAAVCGEGEAKALVRYVLEVRFGLTPTDIYCGKVTQLSADSHSQLAEIMRRLAGGEPVQYVLGQAEFCGRWFEVGPGVLIPRPETEDLCRWVEEGGAAAAPHPRVLDIGTGSGCIAITLALDVAGAEVAAWDVSETALARAGANARRLGAGVGFSHTDALRPPRDESVWDVVVSNPTYVCLSERAGMERNVLGHEPPEALFVPDGDPLRFYRAIAAYAADALKPGGELYFEINPMFADELCAMLRRAGFASASLRDDRFGRRRMAKAIKQ